MLKRKAEKGSTQREGRITGGNCGTRRESSIVIPAVRRGKWTLRNADRYLRSCCVTATLILFNTTTDTIIIYFNYCYCYFFITLVHNLLAFPFWHILALISPVFSLLYLYIYLSFIWCDRTKEVFELYNYVFNKDRKFLFIYLCMLKTVSFFKM